MTGGRVEQCDVGMLTDNSTLLATRCNKALVKSVKGGAGEQQVVVISLQFHVIFSFLKVCKRPYVGERTG